MSAAPDWRTGLSASERYDNIQRIKAAIDAGGQAATQKSAFTVENEAYKASESRAQYDAACRDVLGSQLGGGAAPADSTRQRQDSGTDAAADDDDDGTDGTGEDASEFDSNPDPGVSIGPYTRCLYVGSGVTSSVYRARRLGAGGPAFVALKVIDPSLSARDMEPHNPVREAKILRLLQEEGEEEGKDEPAGPPSLSGSGARPASHIIRLLSSFRDSPNTLGGNRLVLVFPYMRLTLAEMLDRRSSKAGQSQQGPASALLTSSEAAHVVRSMLSALSHLHDRGILHRDVKPGALLLSRPFSASVDARQQGSASNKEAPRRYPRVLLSDFGTAWHPTLSAPPLGNEPREGKVLDVGTGAYRAPECLFGHRAYGAGVDMWAVGCVLAECVAAMISRGVEGGGAERGSDDESDEGAWGHGGSTSSKSKPTRHTLFESRGAHEDGNQLGLILSMFRTLGSPTRSTWPEAAAYRTAPFDMYRVFPERSWRDVLPVVVGDADKETDEAVGGLGVEKSEGDRWRDLVAGLVKYEPGWRLSAEEALQHPALAGRRN